MTSSESIPIVTVGYKPMIRYHLSEIPG